VFASDAYAAEDAAELVTVEIDELPAILDATASPGEFAPGFATEPLAIRKEYGDVEAALRSAAHVISLELSVGRHSGARIDGLLVHIGRSTGSGFQVIEVWESREHYDRYNREVVGPVMADLAQGQPAPAVPPPVEFDVRGLVIPAANLYQ